MFNLWPHQEVGVSAVCDAILRGRRRILLTSPTGGGKTRLMLALADIFLYQGKGVALYTPRRLLVEQAERVLEDEGLAFGVRAADRGAPTSDLFQIVSVQTEYSRSIRK